MEQQKDLGWCVYGTGIGGWRTFAQVVSVYDDGAVELVRSEQTNNTFTWVDRVQRFSKLSQAVAFYIANRQLGEVRERRKTPEEIWADARENFPSYFREKGFTSP